MKILCNFICSQYCDLVWNMEPHFSDIGFVPQYDLISIIQL